MSRVSWTVAHVVCEPSRVCVCAAHRIAKRHGSMTHHTRTAPHPSRDLILITSHQFSSPADQEEPLPCVAVDCEVRVGGEDGEEVHRRAPLHLHHVRAQRARETIQHFEGHAWTRATRTRERLVRRRGCKQFIRCAVMRAYVLQYVQAGLAKKSFFFGHLFFNITNVFCAKTRVGHACICPRMVTS